MSLTTPLTSEAFIRARDCLNNLREPNFDTDTALSGYEGHDTSSKVIALYNDIVASPPAVFLSSDLSALTRVYSYAPLSADQRQRIFEICLSVGVIKGAEEGATTLLASDYDSRVDHKFLTAIDLIPPSERNASVIEKLKMFYRGPGIETFISDHFELFLKSTLPAERAKLVLLISAVIHPDDSIQDRRSLFIAIASYASAERVEIASLVRSLKSSGYVDPRLIQALKEKRIRANEREEIAQLTQALVPSLSTRDRIPNAYLGLMDLWKEIPLSERREFARAVYPVFSGVKDSHNKIELFAILMRVPRAECAEICLIPEVKERASDCKNLRTFLWYLLSLPKEDRTSDNIRNFVEFHQLFGSVYCIPFLMDYTPSAVKAEMFLGILNAFKENPLSITLERVFAHLFSRSALFKERTLQHMLHLLQTWEERNQVWCLADSIHKTSAAWGIPVESALWKKAEEILNQERPLDDREKYADADGDGDSSFF